ncbi:response regulator [Thiolapillus brandeum]|uniref:Two-component system NarL family invasion response regulator UvrY n=1 Tax=Thiolapillus brandeum TaxID=1076588 RepID=A0A7U6GHL2_9GAMM|nr:two-component system NarL family invasion response regulator UvrY [Thiolapillus brandeum]
MMINILLVDDHVLFRSGIKSILDEQEGMEVIAEAESGEEAVEAVRQSPPDVILMDVNMEGIGGIEATRRVLRLAPDVKVIALTALDDTPFPNQLLDAGAVGYVTKGCPADELALAIRRVMRGEHYVCNEVAQRLCLSAVVNKGESTPLAKLSPREMQVMLMITQGKTTQDISDSLFLSPKTISTYRARLFEKLDIHNDVELTHFALRHGLIELNG